MASLDIFNDDAFSLVSLTEAVERLPAVNTQLAAYFEQSSVATDAVWVDLQSGTLQVLATAARGSVATHETGGRSRAAKALSSVKIPTTITMTAADIQNVRAFGTESDLETMQNLVNQKLQDANANIDLTHEAHRAGAFRGVILDKDGTELVNLFTLFGITPNADVYLDLDNIETLTELRAALDGIKNTIRAKAGRTPYTGVVAIAEQSAYQAFVNHPVVLEAFNRWQEGAWLRGDNGGNFSFQGVEFVEYIGTALADGEIRFAPKGVRGLFKTVYTPSDDVEVANTIGRPVYVMPQPMQNTKSWEAEVASYPVHFCSRPELLIGAFVGAEPVEGGEGGEG